jgi:hypothetical protein
MADPTLAVLLRNGSHSSATIRYALKCNDVAISYAKTPIQIPIAQQSPELIDLGYFRPSITCTGLIDTIGENTSNTTSGVAGMASFTYLRANVSNSSHFSDGGHNTTAATYYIPYKNVLEEAVASWLYISSINSLELEIGDAKFPIDSYGGYTDPEAVANRFSTTNQHATGGAIYQVAIQQARFALNAAREDRYDFSLQFVARGRIDLPNTVS